MCVFFRYVLFIGILSIAEPKLNIDYSILSLSDHKVSSCTNGEYNSSSNRCNCAGENYVGQTCQQIRFDLCDKNVCGMSNICNYNATKNPCLQCKVPPKSLAMSLAWDDLQCLQYSLIFNNTNASFTTIDVSDSDFRYSIWSSASYLFNLSICLAPELVLGPAEDFSNLSSLISTLDLQENIEYTVLDPGLITEAEWNTMGLVTRISLADVNPGIPYIITSFDDTTPVDWNDAGASLFNQTLVPASQEISVSLGSVGVYYTITATTGSIEQWSNIGWKGTNMPAIGDTFLFTGENDLSDEKNE